MTQNISENPLNEASFDTVIDSKAVKLFWLKNDDWPVTEGPTVVKQRL